MRYAVKLGEIELRSDKPITEDERKAAIQSLVKKENRPLLYVPNAEIFIKLG